MIASPFGKGRARGIYTGDTGGEVEIEMAKGGEKNG